MMRTLRWAAHRASNAPRELAIVVTLLQKRSEWNVACYHPYRLRHRLTARETRAKSTSHVPHPCGAVHSIRLIRFDRTAHFGDDDDRGRLFDRSRIPHSTEDCKLYGSGLLRRLCLCHVRVECTILRRVKLWMRPEHRHPSHGCETTAQCKPSSCPSCPESHRRS